MRKVGVIGSGRFGLTVATLLARNADVIIYTRRDEVMTAINDVHRYKEVDLDSRIVATNDAELLCEACDTIFPVIPSSYFRSVIQDFSPFLKPHHILIHGTKGLDIGGQNIYEIEEIKANEVSTMSQIILQETKVLRVGCISGPNLAREILAGQPAATVIASEYEEVINRGEELLSSLGFWVFGSNDMRGAEIAGAFKNIIALGSGILAGRGMGKNMQSLIITRGLREMIQFGEFMGASSTSFLGTAGIGDLIATSTSETSRNFTFGKRLGNGEPRESILASMDEVVEGVRTLHTVYLLSKQGALVLPITSILHKFVFDDYDFDRAIKILMGQNYLADVDFI